MACKLFLGGVSPNTTTEVVQDHFSKYGTVIDAIVMYKDGKHRGFGFVTFESEDGMNAALAEEQVIDGRTIDVKPAVPQNEGPVSRMNGGPPGKAMAALPSSRPNADSTPCDKVFLGGLAQTTTEEQVKEYFSQYGTIIDCVVMKDRGTGRSRGFGFVQYDSTEPVEQVMGDYSNHQIDGKWVEVKKAIPQDRIGGAPARGGRGGCGGGLSMGGKGAASAGFTYGGAFGGSFGKGASPAYGAGWQYGGAYGPAPTSYGGYGQGQYGYYPQPGGYSAYGGYPSYGGGGTYGAAPRSTGAVRQGSRPY